MKNVRGLYSFVKGPKWFDYLKNVILNPSIWTIQKDGDKKVDVVLDELITKFQKYEYFVTIDSYAIEFFDKDETSIVRIWISNYPYSYGYAYKFTKNPISIMKSEHPTRYARVLLKRFEEHVKNLKKYNGEIVEELNAESLLKVIRG